MVGYISDLGGMAGFGPVRPEADEPVWHADWERVVFAIQYAMMAQQVYNIDEARHAGESLPPAQYLSSGYYERWLAAQERLLRAKGVLAEGEIESRMAAIERGEPLPEPERRDERLVELVRRTAHQGSPKSRPGAPPRFRTGERVVTRNLQPRGHHRLPGYARGRRGVIDRVYGPFIFPDTHAHGLGEQPQPLYCVLFDGREIWGEAAEPGSSLSLDLWESYLARA